MKPTPKKKQPVKARKRYLLNDGLTLLYAPDRDAKPLYVLPNNAKAYDAMVEQMSESIRPLSKDLASRALAAIGITNPSNDAGRKEGKK